MTKVDFLIGLIILVLIYSFKSKIIRPFVKVNDIVLQYIFMFIFLAYLIFGAFYTFEETKKTFQNVNEGFEEYRTKDEKPHPWWDINTYW